MGFFKDRETPTKLDKMDYSLAEAFHLIVIQKLKVRRKWNKERWAKEFSILRKEVGGYDRIKDVMMWYSSNCGSSRVPSFISAAKFRQHFSWLEKLSGGGKKVEITEAANDLANRLRRGRTWPKGSGDQLPEVVQSCMDNYDKVRKAIFKLKPTGKAALDGFIDHILSRLGTTNHFVEHWMIETNTRVSNWKEWSGDLKSFTFDVAHQRFHNMGKGLATNYGSRTMWDEIVKLLGEKT